MMSIHTPITEEMTAKLVRSLEHAGKGQRDPAALRRTIEEMNRSREESRQQIGTVTVAVDLIRDARS